MDKCCTKYQLHGLHADEQATLEAMLQTAVHVRMLPTHCISETAELQGFSLSVSESELGSVLPFNREMFYGHSLFECRTTDVLINRDVVRLMGSHEHNCIELKALMASIEAEALGHEANFECAPDNADAVMGLHGAMTQVCAGGASRWFAPGCARGSTRRGTAQRSRRRSRPPWSRTRRPRCAHPGP